MMGLFKRILRKDADQLGPNTVPIASAQDLVLSEILQLAKSAIGNPDEYAKFVSAESIVRILYPKYKFSEFGRIFLEDDEFIAYYEKFMDPNNWHSLDRKYLVREFLKQTDHVKGDYAECGVYQGATSFLMCEHGLISKRHVHLFDSFEGISAPMEHDGTYWTEGAFSTGLDPISKNLAEFPNHTVYAGWIPSRFDEVKDCEFSFVHIDVDLYEPTKDSVDYFYGKINAGGIMLFDDYGFSSCPGAKKAIDDFFDSRPENVVKLPTGQALIIKI